MSQKHNVAITLVLSQQDQLQIYRSMYNAYSTSYTQTWSQDHNPQDQDQGHGLEVEDSISAYT